MIRAAIAGMCLVASIHAQSQGPFAWGEIHPLAAPVGITVPELVDLDGDGDLDALVALHPDSSIDVGVLMNDGSARFTVAQSLPTPAPFGLSDIDVGDINGDGHLDLVALDVANDTIVTSFGDGSGVFPPFIVSTVSDETTFIRLADLDGDGRDDLVCTSFDVINRSYTMLSNGDGTYTEVWSGPTTSANVFRPGDFDGDGVVDALRLLPAGGIQLAVGNGDGTFTLATAQPTAFPFPRDVQFADINGDTHLDLVVLSGALTASSELATYLGDSTGTFTLRDTLVVTPTESNEIRVGDLDEDGAFDVFVSYDASSASANILGEFVRGTATGLFASSETIGPFGVDVEPFLIGDVDGDGHDEMTAFQGSGIFESASMTLHLDDTAPYTRQTLGTPIGVAALDLAAADIDRDGDTDIIAALPSEFTLRVLVNDGAGDFPTSLDSTLLSKPADFVVTDLDGNGTADMATAVPNTSDSVWVYDNNGAGAFTLAQGGVIPAGDGPITVVAGDLDGDGLQDLVTASQNSETIEILIANGTSFTPTTSIPVDEISTQLRSVRLTDLDRDGNLDLVSTFSDVIVTLLGDGAGHFTPFQFIEPTSFFGATGQSAAVDLDGDLDIDLVTLRGDGFRAFVNDGTGLLAAPVLTPIAFNANDYAVGDVNGDGIADIAMTGTRGWFGWALGVGDGTFEIVEQFVSFGAAGRFVLGEFTGAGAFDLAIKAGANLEIVSRINDSARWLDLGSARTGTSTTLQLDASGELLAATAGSYRVQQGDAFEPVTLVVGLSTLFAPFKAGLLVPFPDMIVPLALDANGTLELPFVWPAGIPSGVSIATQVWAPDAGAPKNFTASNALAATTP